jgi:S1-C subfamily serine protease
VSVARHGCGKRWLVLALLVQAGLFAALPSAQAAASVPVSTISTALTAKVAAGLVDINATLGNLGSRVLATGIVLSAGGVAITTNGAIRGSTAIRVTDIANGHSYAATVTGYDISDDIAVLQVHSAAGLVTAPLASSVPTEYGLPVVPIGDGLPATKWNSTIGYVQGYDQSVTLYDPISGINQSVHGLIEANAPTKDDYQGAALAAARGKVIGVVVGGSATITFAVPITSAMSIARKIEAAQFTDGVHAGPTAFLGVLDENVPSTNEGGHTDVFVLGVIPGSPAARAGLTSGDVITDVDGKRIRSTTDLSDILLPKPPGEKVRIAWVDPSGNSHNAIVTLAPGPPD